MHMLGSIRHVVSDHLLSWRQVLTWFNAARACKRSSLVSSLLVLDEFTQHYVTYREYIYTFCKLLGSSLSNSVVITYFVIWLDCNISKVCTKPDIGLSCTVFIRKHLAMKVLWSWYFTTTSYYPKVLGGGHLIHPCILCGIYGFL